MRDLSGRLRVALLAGTLGKGGAEKQLAYMARVLQRLGVDVRVFSLTEGEFYETLLRAKGIQVIPVGRFANRMLRLVKFGSALLPFRPHVIHSAHSFTNLYAALAARLLGAVSVGALRSGLAYSEAANGFWTRWLMRMPNALLVNSEAGLRDLLESGYADNRHAYLLSNYIDLTDTDLGCAEKRSAAPKSPSATAIFVGSLIPIKRVDRFLEAFARALRQEPTLRAIVVGDGPERQRMQERAMSLGAGRETVRFFGAREDVPALLRETDMLVLSSDQEGFPNVLLEAMAARLPVVSTPAGDAGLVVRDGVTGYVVGFDDVAGMADRMVRLARSADLRRELGEAGRRRVEQHYSLAKLADRLLSIYHDIARQNDHRRLLRELAPYRGCPNGWNSARAGPEVSPSASARLRMRN